MNPKGKQIAEALTKEAGEWTGVETEIAQGSKHPKIKLKFEGQIMSVSFSGTPSSRFSITKALADVRRALKQMGAVRLKPEPTREEEDAIYHPKNDGKEKREAPKAELAAVEPDLVEKMVEAGVVTEAQATRSRAEPTEGPRAQEGEPAGNPEEERLRAAFQARVDGIVDGVYFGLPADVYHAVPRLSSSGIQKIDISPATFWAGSWLDPRKPDPLDEEDTIWQILGRAYHTARLEPHLFEKEYFRELEKSELPKGTLFTGNDMKAELTDYGLTKSGSVLELAERLAEAGFPEDLLWPIRMQRWEEERGTRTPLAAKHYDQMLLDRDLIETNTEIVPLLSGGEAEVSIFWTDEYGIQMKSRTDYLTREHWTDFKTFDNSNGKKIDQALADSMRFRRYHIQGGVYREAIEAIRIGGLDVIEAQTEDQRALIAAIRINPVELECHFVFQEKGGIPNLLAREFEFYAVPYRDLFEIESLVTDEDRKAAVIEARKHPTQLFTKAENDILAAKKNFVLYSQVYRAGEAWQPIKSRKKFKDDDFHPYWLSGDLI